MSLVVPTLEQLTYASTDKGNAAGGWQVIGSVGELDAEAVAALARRMPTTIEATIPIPDYPVPGLPIRMEVGRIGGLDADVVWHSVPAGRDGTGRPGNVFSHCLVVGPSPCRLTQLWGSPAWLAPFGARAVAAAALPDDRQFPAVDWISGMTEFLFDPQRWGVGTLCLLVDAVSAALNGGPRVVLEVADCQEGAAWIMAVSFCTDAFTARQIRFSTWERAQASQQWGDMHIVCIPHDDHDAALALTGCVVVDTSILPTLGEWNGQPHVTDRGDKVVVTPWSIALMDRCGGPGEFAQMVEAIDHLRADFDSVAWEPAWPLAYLAFAAQRDAVAESAVVLTRTTPEQVEQDPQRLALVTQALDLAMGSSTQEQWDELQRMATDHAAGFMVRMAARNFLCRALSDVPWLGGQDRCPALPPGISLQLTADTQASVAAALSRHANVDPWSAGDVRAALFMIDLVVQVGWTMSTADDVGSAALALARRLADAISADDDAVASTVPLLDEPAVAEIVSLVVRNDVLIPSRMVGVFGFDQESFLSSARAWDDSSSVTSIATQASEQVLSDPQGRYSEELRRQARFLVTVAGLSGRLGASGFSGRVPGPRLLPQHVSYLVGAFGQQVPDDLLAPELCAMASSDDYPQLAAQVRQVGHPLADFAAALDRLAGVDWMRSGLDTARYDVDAILRARAMNPDLPLGEDVIRAAQLISLGMLLLRTRGARPFPGPPGVEFAPGMVALLADGLLPQSGFPQDVASFGAKLVGLLVRYGAGSPLRESSPDVQWMSALGRVSDDPGALIDVLTRWAKARDVKVDADQVGQGVEQWVQWEIQHGFLDAKDPNLARQKAQAEDYAIRWANRAGVLHLSLWARAKKSALSEKFDQLTSGDDSVSGRR